MLWGGGTTTIPYLQYHTIYTHRVRCFISTIIVFVIRSWVAPAQNKNGRLALATPRHQLQLGQPRTANIRSGNLLVIQFRVAPIHVGGVGKAKGTSGKTGLVVQTRPSHDIGLVGRQGGAHAKGQTVGKGILQAHEQVTTGGDIRQVGDARDT